MVDHVSPCHGSMTGRRLHHFSMCAVSQSGTLHHNSLSMHDAEPSVPGSWTFARIPGGMSSIP
eukprot:502472-Rhodomonas_salina.2